MRNIKGKPKLHCRHCHMIHLVKTECHVSALANLRDKRPRGKPLESPRTPNGVIQLPVVLCW